MNKVMKQVALAAVVGAGLFVAAVPAQAAFSKYTLVQAKAAISYDRAVEIFKAQYPDYQIKDVDFDVDHGRPHYEIEGFRGYEEVEVKIDATTGEIYRMKYDRD